MSSLALADVARYHRDGFYFPVRVLSREEARRCRDRLEAVERAQGGPLGGLLRQKCHLLFPWLHFEAEEPPAADLDPAALARHAAILKRQGEILYRGASVERFR